MQSELKMFKALSDETRLRILLLLLIGELCVCDLENILGTTQSKISRHLSYLKNSGLVNDRRKNVWVYYSLNQDNNHFTQELINFLKKSFSMHPLYLKDVKKLNTWLNEKKNKC